MPKLLSQIRRIRLNAGNPDLVLQFNQKLDLCRRFVEESQSTQSGHRDIGRLVQTLYSQITSGKMSEVDRNFNLQVLQTISHQMQGKTAGVLAVLALTSLYSREEMLAQPHDHLFQKALGFAPKLQGHWAKDKGEAKRQAAIFLKDIVRTQDELRETVRELQELRLQPLREEERQYLELFIEELYKQAPGKYKTIVDGLSWINLH